MATTPTGKDATTPRPGADSPQPDPKLLLDLLDFVIAKSGWTKPLGVNPGRGIAVWQLHDTYLAQVSEVTVSTMTFVSIVSSRHSTADKRSI
jgi:hypothetical protein